MIAALATTMTICFGLGFVMLLPLFLSVAPIASPSPRSSLALSVSLSAAGASFVGRDAQRKLTVGEAEFPVTGDSGEEYEVEFHDESGADVEVVVMTESEEVPEETTVTVVDGSITTVVVGTETYAISYDSDGEVTHLTLVPGSSTTRCGVT